MDSFKKLTKKNLVPFILKDPKKIFMKSSELSPNDGHRHVKGSLLIIQEFQLIMDFIKT